MAAGVVVVLSVGAPRAAAGEGDGAALNLRSVLQSLLGAQRAPSDLGAPQRAEAPNDANRPGSEEPSGPAQAEPGASDDAGASRVQVGSDNRITIHLNRVPLAEAMRMLSGPTRRNIVLASGVDGEVSVSLYDVTFERALSAMLTANKLGFTEDKDCVYVFTLEDMAKMEQGRRKIGARVFQLTYLNGAAAKSLVEPMLTPSVGKVAVTPAASRGLGGGSTPGGSSSDSSGGSGRDTEGDALAGGDALLVTDFEDQLERIAAALKQLDAQPRQVLVEATILRATLNEDNALGIDFTTVGGVDFQELNSVSPAAQTIATGATPSAKLSETTFTARTDFNGAVPNGGFTFGIIKDQVGVFIRALEQITDTSVLANPKMLALNKQLGQVIVGRRDGYLTTTVTETTTVQTVEFLETGTVLTFRPFIGDDGTIRMEIHPKDSTGGLTPTGLPFEQTTEVTTNILVRDGHTILIGGLFREVSQASRGQVPLLGNIPWLGAVFRQTQDTSLREEVIILLTVHVVKSDADTKASDEVREDLERFRVGMRRGLQWFGRERLAQAHFRWATDHLARGDIDQALWDARIAIHNYPRHLAAMKLRELLSGRRWWESDASSIRTFVMDRIAEENQVHLPHFGRPGPPYELPEGFEGPVGFDNGEIESSPGQDHTNVEMMQHEGNRR